MWVRRINRYGIAALKGNKPHMRDVIYRQYKPPIHEIKEMGLVRFYDAIKPMETESHEHAYELTYVYSGHVYMKVGGCDHSLFGGDLLCVAPGTCHDTGNFIQNKAIVYYIHLHHPVKNGFYGMDASEAAELGKGLKNCANQKLTLTQKGCAHLVSLFDDDSLPLSGAVARGKLVMLLREVLLSQASPEKTAVPDDISYTLQHIRSFPGQIRSVAELASMVHLSLPRFKQKFKEYVGIPPAEFILRAKLNESAKLLRNENTRIIEVAMNLGFSTSQHFSVVFKRYFNMTPYDYRQLSKKTDNEIFNTFTHEGQDN